MGGKNPNGSPVVFSEWRKLLVWSLAHYLPQHIIRYIYAGSKIRASSHGVIVEAWVAKQIKLSRKDNNNNCHHLHHHLHQQHAPHLPHLLLCHWNIWQQCAADMTILLSLSHTQPWMVGATLSQCYKWGNGGSKVKIMWGRTPGKVDSRAQATHASGQAPFEVHILFILVGLDAGNWIRALSLEKCMKGRKPCPWASSEEPQEWRPQEHMCQRWKCAVHFREKASSVAEVSQAGVAGATPLEMKQVYFSLIVWPEEHTKIYF